jgi:uncharacterized protein YgbK (DUF1537 family)
VNPPSGKLLRAKAFGSLPPVWAVDLQPFLRTAAKNGRRTLVVLDDDPTGTQTVYDTPVVTCWDFQTLEAELARKLPCFFISTNSRSLTGRKTRALTLELARNLRRAAESTGRAFTIVSRSDSTLRGHFPVETDALAEVFGPIDATIVAPFFGAGGRYTLGDVHYVAEGEVLVPAAETPFARDAVFGYRHSNLRDWVEEKTGRRIHAGEVKSLSLETLRRGGPIAVAAALLALPPGSVCIANLCATRDAEVLAAAALAAERKGKVFVFRTAASFVSARLGLVDRPLLAASDFESGDNAGGLVVVGSHVPKSSEQLEHLLASNRLLRHIELEVAMLLEPKRREAILKSAAKQIAEVLSAGEDIVVFTSRRLVTMAKVGATLAMGRKISEALVSLIRRLRVRPRFIIAKGGVTSSDIASGGLGVRRAVVRGQVLPGVPVWRLGTETRFPGLNYVVFPGNVGQTKSLAEAFQKLSGGRRPKIR